MKFFVYVAEVFVGDMGINLGSAYVGVAEQSLDGAQIGAVTKQISGKKVTHHVGCNLFRNSSFDGMLFYNSLNRSLG